MKSIYPILQKLLLTLNGYYENKPVEQLNINDLKAAAEYRGGKCLDYSSSDFYGEATWQCSFGHKFNGSPNLILKGGHWCTECESDYWNYSEIASVSPFFNQVWSPIHDKNEKQYLVKNSQ